MLPAHAIIFSGGGTMGSVSPLYALVEKIKIQYPDVPCIWFGTWRGIERAVVAPRMPYVAICNGKWRRYTSFRTFIDPFFIVAGLVQSIIMFAYLRPRLVVSAGAFVAVPLHWAARILRIPSLEVQLDVRPGLAHTLIALFANRRVVVLNTPTKTGVVPAAFPVRKNIYAAVPATPAGKERAVAHFNLRLGHPTLLVMGGGLGAVALNEVMRIVAPSLLPQCNIIQVTGRHGTLLPSVPGYYVSQFLDEELPYALAAADVVVGRAGMGMIAECARAGLAVILVPLPYSVQEDNAAYFRSRGAAIVIAQDPRLPAALIATCERLCAQPAVRAQMGIALAEAVPTDDGTSLVKHISELCSL